MNDDEQWLRDELAGVVPSAPATADRMAGILQHRRSRRRRMVVATTLAAAVTVVAAAFAGQALVGGDSSSGPASSGPTRRTSTPADVLLELECPTNAVRNNRDDRGPGRLARGATAARLCSLDRDPTLYVPLDTLHSRLGSVIAAVNDDPGPFTGCLAVSGPNYLLLVSYPGDVTRGVVVSFADCGYTQVGRRNGGDPAPVMDAYFRSLRQQRMRSVPPASVPEPTCALQQIAWSHLAGPGQMVAARFCFDYSDGRTRTSVLVSDVDLQAILDAWRTGPRTPITRPLPCRRSPVWILSGVTRWGDPVTIDGRCDLAANGNDWVTLTPEALLVVNRLIASSGTAGR